LSEKTTEVLVIGAGAAGLAAACESERNGRQVQVVYAGDLPGGVMGSDRIDGFLVEHGPNTFQIKAGMRSFVRDHGLDDVLTRATPASRKRFVFRDGGLLPVPMDPVSLVRTPLLSARGKLRLLAEPFIRAGDPSGESVADFCSRRLGSEVVSGLIGPFLTGVYAGDETRLGVEAVFPALADLEREYGSLVRGGIARLLRRSGERGLPGTWSAPDGLGNFAGHLAAGLAQPPLGQTRAVALRHDGDAWVVNVCGPGGESTLRAESVIVATPASQAAQLLRGVDADAADVCDSVEYAPVVSVSLGVDPREVREVIEGFGFIVPRDAGLGLLGCLFMSRLFPGRAPEGRELLQCLMGGVRWPEAVEFPDDALRDRLHQELDQSLGLRGEPEMLAIYRWPQAVPQPDVSHVRRIAGLQQRLAQRPGLAVAGSYLTGVAVSDTFESGVRAARSL